MSWADLLKSIVCVLNLIACVRLTGPYLIPKRSDVNGRKRDVVPACTVVWPAG